MSLTSIARVLFRGRQRELETYPEKGEQMQRDVLNFLLMRAKDTEYGRKHLFNHIKSYIISFLIKSRRSTFDHIDLPYSLTS